MPRPSDAVDVAVRESTAVSRRGRSTQVTTEMFQLYKKKLIHDANDFEWTKQARFYWRPQASDDCSPDGSVVIAITNFVRSPRFEVLRRLRAVDAPRVDQTRSWVVF